MTYIQVPARTETTVASRLMAFANRVSEWLHVFAAATRAARAVEARRDPRPADLQLLGIEGKLPKAW